uniref:Uncharacterized protein n=1 Tax=Megaselia scalaris TaxID=36166 RepID=T1GN00_MEGSC
MGDGLLKNQKYDKILKKCADSAPKKRIQILLKPQICIFFCDVAADYVKMKVVLEIIFEKKIFIIIYPRKPHPP